MKGAIKIQNITSTYILILTLAATLILAIFGVEKVIRYNCYQNLADAVKQGATNIRSILENGEQQLQSVSVMLAAHLNLDITSAEHFKFLTQLPNNNLISTYIVLLPDNKLLFPYQKNIHPLKPLLFKSNIEAKVNFIDRYAIDDNGTLYSALCTPIMRDGVTIAILYGLINLNDIPKRFPFQIYNGNGQAFLIDAQNGNLLIDTWHKNLGNMYDVHFSSNETKFGTSFEQMRRDIKNEQSGFVIFKSQQAGEDFYSYYHPVEKYHLSFQIIVPQSVAFAEEYKLQQIVLSLGCAQLTAILIYAFLLMRKTSKRRQQDKQRIELIQSVNKIQRTLFGVYKNPYLINVSLEMLEQTIGSDRIVLMLLNDGVIDKFFSLPQYDEKERAKFIGLRIPQIVIDDINTHLEEKGITLYAESNADKLTLAQSMPGLSGETEIIRNLTAVWTLNSDREIIGLAYAINVDDPESCREVLSTIVSSYQMAIQTMDSYNMLYQMGKIDNMTGLKNRNAYQKDISQLGEMTDSSFCCIYIDANGLHEMNNRLGHSAGDKMLISIGKEICTQFRNDSHDAYRIGGDEFIIFCRNIPEKLIQEKINNLKEHLERLHYFVSIGHAFAKDGLKPLNTITQAESIMYKQKMHFYSGDRDRRKARTKNIELENLLLEKHIQDDFLSAISSKYLGVYAVNLITNNTRIIYKPIYFDEILKKSDFNYKVAIKEYIRKFVDNVSYNDFMSFIDYERLDKALSAGQSPRLIYRKKNGDYVQVRVLPMSKYSDTNKTTLWIFERESSAKSGHLPPSAATKRL